MRHVENSSGRDTIHPYEHFEIIAGTGTGGVSACMLGRLRMPIAKAIERYARFVEEVFTDKKWYGPTMYKATKLQEALKSIVREETGDEAALMYDGQESNACKTIVFAMAGHNLNAGLPVMFRSYSVATNTGPNCPIWRAGHATMAQTGLFKHIEIFDSAVSQSFVGGELGCSNPVAHVLSEAARLFPEGQVGSIISIGAGHARTIQLPSASRWSRSQDVMIMMKDLATDSERVSEEMAARFQGTVQVYFRFNVDQGMQDMKSGSWERLGEAIQHAKAYLQKHHTNQHLDLAVRASVERRGTVPTAFAAGQISGALLSANQTTSFKLCPRPTKFYTGRNKENAQVIACITGGKSERRVCVIYGLGGVGKTQLVLNAVKQTWDQWDHVIYVDASSTEAIEKALTEFGKAKSIGEGYKDVMQWLESRSERWLLVFDNADTASTNIRQYIPAGDRTGRVLITTRLPDLASLAEGPEAVCHLSRMSQTDGTALLVKIATMRGQRPSDDDMQVAEDFGGLALAIVHAGAYIAHSPGVSISAYRLLFLSQRQRMLNEYNKLPAMAKLDSRGDTVYTTWKMCYDQLDPESHQMLWLIAYLHYDRIYEDIFKRAALNIRSRTHPLPLTDLELQAQDLVNEYLLTFLDSDGSWDTVKFMRVVADLIAYSLLEFDHVNTTYRVHVLVHDWAKTVVPHAPELAAECTATLVSLSIDWKKDMESLAFKRQLELHVTSVLMYCPAIGANHVSRFERVYSGTGQWGKRMKLLQQLCEAFKQMLGEKHRGTLNAMNQLARTYIELGQYNKAEQLGTQVVSMCKKALGVEDSDTLDSMGNLAWAYSQLGRYNKTEQLEIQVVNAHKQVLGEQHPSTLTSMSNLALTYLRLGQYNKAEQLGIQVVNARKQVLGEQHPSTLTSMNNLASTYSRLGRYNKAEQLGIQVVNARKQVLGEQHPDTLTSMSNLASTYSYLGRYNEAEQLGIQVVNARKQVQGEKHPDTLTSMSNLASTYSQLGRYNEAEHLGTQVLNTRKRLLGEEHPDTLISMSNLAWTYSRMGQWDEASELYHTAISTAEQTLGHDHPDTQLFHDLLKELQTMQSPA
ncbi:Nephrocystin-3 [Mus musculus] [Rhizoctonia solani]|uniref:Nephrocystin-3 [Mus musculus] n=1 Tax=Rhizoctonia solani TaxID=456999 RepID=A0A0K6GDE6_9AGAM|nr:Nephrocystin-3 [Mus musculus] [Rhizoctonia solani]